MKWVLLKSVLVRELVGKSEMESVKDGLAMY